MKNLARKNILKIKPYIPGKPIEELKRELGLEEAIKLASNENAFPPSRDAIRAAEKSLRSINRYPDGGCFYLKKALAGRLKVKPENIIVGNGSDEIIVLALRAFVKPLDEVIIAKPTFLIYEIASKVHDAKIKFAPLKDLRYDVKKIASLISKKTKLIFIANPDNPTGTYITKDEMEFLISRIPKNTILFIDEAYFEFAEDVKDYPKTKKYLEKKNIIITRSFSKIYSLAGLRVGYGMAREGIIDCLNRAREPFNVNSVAQAAAVAALSDAKHVEKTKKLVENGKRFLCEKLDSMGIGYVPSVTNFLLFKVNKDGKKIYRKLLRRGVIVREMSAWKLDNCIRVTVGTMPENKKFIKALKESLP
ncbi:MAG: histidinol-phosphate transaminase [Candidatus Omnitrophica bacterium]|nr:histidinol-phosphate transaminase [Candidatus Omnitrophota bacterium]